MARVPIVRLGDTLIVTVQDDLRDSDALNLLQNLGEAIERGETRGVILDLTAVDMVDSFLGRLLGDLAAGTSLLGARTVVVGIQPAVAITLVELGLDLKGVQTALNLDKGVSLLKRLVAREDRRGQSRVR